MRIVLIGSVQFSLDAGKAVVDAGGDIVGVITRTSSKQNADFVSLEPFAKENSAELYLAKKNDQEDMLDWLKKIRPDVIFCFGWSYLLKSEILNLPPLGVVGFHPTLLPSNRGRHPIIWALVLGLEETGSTFFVMDEGADSGDILSQETIDIKYEDNAESLYNKITSTAITQIKKFVPLLQRDEYKPVRQDSSQANYWRKRGKSDGKIDWRMSSYPIYNLVRALSKPYIGAHAEYNGEDIKIWRVKEVKVDCNNIVAGQIISVDENSFVVKCGVGAVEVLEHGFKNSFKEGDSI